jgi:glyoxylase-like metal-dependent hydrolase (beta-lactamase superfamily II)
MIREVSKNVYKLYFDAFGSCVYVLKLDKNILVDTSSKENKNELISDLNQIGLKPEDIQIILLTHTHWDHNGNIGLFKNAKVYKKDNIEQLKNENLDDFKIIDTPGHTKDSICFLYKDILFSGDTIFDEGGIGRTDLAESQPEKMRGSLNKLKKIKYNILCAGHVD